MYSRIKLFGLLFCLTVLISNAVGAGRRRHDVKQNAKDKSVDEISPVSNSTRKNQDSNELKTVTGSSKAKALLRHGHTEINGTGCELLKCDKNQICVSHSPSGETLCVHRKLLLSRTSRGHGKLLGKDVSYKQGYGSWQLQQRAKRIKEDTHNFEMWHDKKQKKSLENMFSKMPSQTTKNPTEMYDSDMQNDAASKPVSEMTCHKNDLNGMGYKLLDHFKKQQEDMSGRRKKEKRNSTKKELHEDDECMCQATVSWAFQQLDRDVNGRLSRQELDAIKVGNDVNQVCVGAFVKACDHNADAALTEKEWCCCFSDVLPPCLAALSSVPSILVQGQPSVIAGSFVPDCDDDGFYKPAQCDSTTGQCWCVDHNGHTLNGTLTSSGSPSC